MKNELKISTLSIVCVLCATAFSGAYGASTVRTLGGTGTYNSVSAASASGANSGVARAGVARVTPAGGRVTSVAKPSGATSTTSGAASRVSTAPRLSLGKYLGSTTNVNRPSGGNGSSNPGLSGEEDYSTQIENLQKQIDAADAKLKDAMAAVNTLQETVKSIEKSPVQGVVEGGYITIDTNGMAYLNVEELGTDSDAWISDGTKGKQLNIRVGLEGTPFSIPLSELLASVDMNAEIDTKLKEYVTKTDFETALLDKADVTDLNAKADKLTAGEYTAGNIATVGTDGGYVDSGMSTDDLKELKNVIWTENESGEPVTKFQQLQTEITINMTEMLDTNFTQVVDGKLVIKDNSIEGTKLKAGAVTGDKIAEGTIAKENLAETITKQLVGTPDAGNLEDSGADGMYVMLVDKDGNQYWVNLATEGEAEGTD